MMSLERVLGLDLIPCIVSNDFRLEPILQVFGNSFGSKPIPCDVGNIAMPANVTVEAF